MLDVRPLQIAILVSLMLSACASYEQQHVDYGASQFYSNSVTENSVTLAADPYDTEAEVVGAFDENLLEKGYYPIKILIENNSEGRVMVFREAIELRGPSGYIYRPVSASELAENFEDNKIGYAFMGGILSYMSAEEANKDRLADYQSKELGESQIIYEGRSRGAFVYFKLPVGSDLNGSVLDLDIEHLDSKETTRFQLPLGQMQARAGASVASGSYVTMSDNLPKEAKATNESPFDGVWTGNATILHMWCVSGAKHFNLTLTVENGQIRGGDPEGHYVANGKVSEDGRLKNATLNNYLLMEGTISKGIIRLQNRECNAEYALTKTGML